MLGKTNWCDSTIVGILENEVYKGDFVHGKNIKHPTYYEDVVEPIISKEMWDLACEIIIELGDMDFGEDKELGYRKEMTKVYTEQIEELNALLPTFKIANAIVHFEERLKSPHMHIVGVPVIENCKRGIKKQVGKTQVFTKESLTEIQDKMRIACIKSYNRIYNNDMKLKSKQKGRNFDINVKDMDIYKKFANNYEKHNNRLKLANTKANGVYTASAEVKSILNSLKPNVFNKNTSVITNDYTNKINEFIENVEDTMKTINTVNELNIVIDEFRNSYNELDKENRSLKYQLECKDEEIGTLKNDISDKDKIINKLRTEKESLKTQLKKFKDFWHSIMNHFHKRVNYDKDESYKIVSDDLHKNGIFSDDDFEIATNILRKVTLNDTNIKKKNDKNLN